MIEGLRGLLASEHVRPADASLYEFRRVGPLPAWSQALAVVACWVATVLLTHREFREHGTVFGFPGPGFNVLFAPIYEELVFRGWILGTLARRRSNLLALVVSSLLFGLLHLRNVYWLEPAELARSMAYTGLVLGPAAGWLTLRTRTVWPAVLLHFAYNLWYYV